MGKRPGQVGMQMAPDVLRRFEELTLPHLKSLFGLAVRLTGDGSTLRDPGRVRSWLFQILSRLATDRQRTEGREVLTGDPRELDRFSLYDSIAEEDPLPYSDRLHEDFLAEFRDEEVRGALLALPEEYRVPLVLVYAEGMSYRELATILGCPMRTVMSRLHRGRKILERELWECAKRRGLVRTWKP